MSRKGFASDGSEMRVGYKKPTNPNIKDRVNRFTWSVLKRHIRGV